MQSCTDFRFNRETAEVVPENYFVPLNLPHLFGRIAPVDVDLGCGDGAFLAALAAQNPDRNFLGIERLFGRVRRACRKLADEEIGNARLLRVESSYAIRYLLPPDSISLFYLNFPDPWPKRRHQRRRIVSKEFLESVYSALLQGGLLAIATDQLDYLTHVQRVLNEVVGFVLDPVTLVLPISTFEKRFRDQRQKIYRLALRKVCQVK
jgi:tRNA (guanine-N7-)-methyltransferase